MNIDISKYPISVFYSKVSVLEHSQFKEKILGLIDEYPEEIEGSKYFSKLDWKSSKDPEREWTKLASGFINSYNNVIGHGTGYSDPVIIDIWFQQYKKMNRHPWHIHGGQFVGVYYVELPEDAPKTQLVPSWDHSQIIDVDVKEGDILIFPSMLIHQAPTINTDTRKTIISWNLVYENPANYVMEKLDNERT
jgi:hypothetical protein